MKLSITSGCAIEDPYEKHLLDNFKKDYGDDAVTPLTLRAKSIKIQNGGELWIGSRQCRYQGKADIVLYGNKEDMPSHSVVGEKYLWTKADGTLEIHGKEKKSWTKAWLNFR